MMNNLKCFVRISYPTSLTLINELSSLIPSWIRFEKINEIPLRNRKFECPNFPIASTHKQFIELNIFVIPAMKIKALYSFSSILMIFYKLIAEKLNKKLPDHNFVYTDVVMEISIFFLSNHFEFSDWQS